MTSISAQHTKCCTQVFVGLVVRDHLMVLLRQALGRGGEGPLSYSDLNRRYVSSAAQRIISEQQMAVLQARKNSGLSSRVAFLGFMKWGQL